MNKIKILGRSTETNSKSILSYIRDQYELLYKAESVKDSLKDKIIENLGKISTENNNKLMERITKEEIIQVIKELSNNKAPGMD
ncbi:2085_t:CDS:1, partial [Scutellospora calospora]